MSKREVIPHVFQHWVDFPASGAK